MFLGTVKCIRSSGTSTVYSDLICYFQNQYHVALIESLLVGILCHLKTPLTNGNANILRLQVTNMFSNVKVVAIYIK